jgi:hypothetical protein
MLPGATPLASWSLISVFPHRVARVRLREPHRVADDEEQLERDPFLIAHLAERPPAEPGEPVVHRPIEERQGQSASTHRFGDVLEGEPRVLESPAETGAPRVGVGEPAVVGRNEEAHVHEPLDEGGLDPGSLRDLTGRDPHDGP